MYESYLKRLFDLLAAFAAFLLLLPVFVLTALVLMIANAGSPFFFQTRPGKDAKLFRIIKFKTMNDRKNNEGELLSDAERLTFAGSVVRKLSLDEIPQLLNVIKGDMSLVGPRPLLVEYLSLYNDEQARRHSVKPGISGWAQINGRNAISWQKKFELDVYYVDHLTFGFDIRIIFLTIKKVFISEGISSDTSVTIEKFKGN